MAVSVPRTRIFFGEKALANGVYWNAYLIEIAYNEFMSFNKKEIKELN